MLLPGRFLLLALTLLLLVGLLHPGGPMDPQPALELHAARGGWVP